MYNKVKLLTICVCLLNIFDCYNTYPSYQNIIPNGDRIPNPCSLDTIWGGVGHQLPSGGGSLNPFGIDLFQNKVNNGEIWSKDVCEADSDGDGRTNGEELGDPKCQWSTNGHILLSNLTVTHPGICDPVDSEHCMKTNKWLKCEKEHFECGATKEQDVKKLTLRIPETEVQQHGSKYMCTHLHVPMEGNYHVVAVEPLINNTEVVHHIVLYGCHKTENNPKINSPTTCDAMEGPSYCTQLNVWAVGIHGECFPDKFGIPIGSHGYTHFMLQIHWHNYNNRPGLMDSSGLTLYYTTRLRPYNSAVLTIGQSGLFLKPGKKRIEVNGSCAGQCTKRDFKGPIYIHSAFNHMHSLGRQQKIIHYRNGTLMNVITDQSDFSFLRTTRYTQTIPVEVLPGDELRTTCVYDTTSRNETTTFGRGTEHEMCFGFLTFYPAENAPDKLQCFSWFKISHCLINDITQFATKVKSNPWLKLGIKSIMKTLIKNG